MVHYTPSADLPTIDSPTTTMAEQLAAAVASLPKLKTMHIRNSPEMHIDPDCFRYESLYQSLAEELYHALPTTSNVKAIRLNSLSFRYDWIGSNSLCDPSKIFDFEHFRLYHGSSKLGARDTKPRLVAKGVCDEAEGVVDDLSIFRQFWGPLVKNTVRRMTPKVLADASPASSVVNWSHRNSP